MTIQPIVIMAGSSSPIITITQDADTKVVSIN